MSSGMCGVTDMLPIKKTWRDYKGMEQLMFIVMTCTGPLDDDDFWSVEEDT